LFEEARSLDALTLEEYSAVNLTALESVMKSLKSRQPRRVVQAELAAAAKTSRPLVA
jgi:hypothetical protein